MLGVSADDKHCVTVDGKVVVGRRLHHRAGSWVLACTGVTSPIRPERRGRAALSGLNGRRHGRWSRIRALSSGRRSGPSDLFDPSVTQMYDIFTQRAYWYWRARVF